MQNFCELWGVPPHTQISSYSLPLIEALPLGALPLGALPLESRFLPPAVFDLFTLAGRFSVSEPESSSDARNIDMLTLDVFPVFCMETQIY